MKTIYTILYITLNTALKEKVSIGLLLSNGKDHIFKYSLDKLLAIKGLIDIERFNFCKSYLKSLESDINITDKSTLLFENKTSKKDWITESYISYLAKYSNNLIQFSEPRFIDIDFDENNFKRLFEKYIHVYEHETYISVEETIYDKVKTKLYPRISNRVNLEISLDSSHFENLFAPVAVDFIGINGVPVAGQTINFDKQHYNLENDVARFVSLTKAIELEDKNKGQYFVLGREPKKSNDKNHLLWEQIRDSNFLEFVDIEDIGTVETYIQNNDVRPYFSK